METNQSFQSMPKGPKQLKKGLFLQKIYYASHFAVEIDQNSAHKNFSKFSFFCQNNRNNWKSFALTEFAVYGFYSFPPS